MSNAQHTPAPWTVNKPGEPARPYIIADTSNGKDMMRCVVAFGEPTGGQGWPHIDRDGFYTYEQARANARLIAAAPEMYEALRDLLNHTRPDNMDGLSDEDAAVFDAAESILARVDTP